MKINLKNVLKRGGIIFRTIGSAMPGLSFQALRIVYPRKSEVELWYGGDDVQYEVIETLDGELNYRDVALAIRNSEALQLPDSYFHEMKVEGVSGLWKEILCISLHEEHREIIDYLLSFDDNELERFWRTNGPFMSENDFNDELIENLTHIMEYRIPETDKKGTLSHIFSISSASNSLCLTDLDADLEIWEEEEEKRLEFESEIAVVRQREIETVLAPFQSKIDLAVQSCTQFSNFTDHYPDQLQSNLKIFLKNYAVENQCLPNRRICVFRWAVWIRRYAYRFSESNKIWADIRKGSSSEFREICAIGYIDFKAMNQLFKWDD
ncbi:MAG: hypothetical protein CL661_08690 [Bacteroidetes bacterium]|nr:hypothetical protein [Bacteroidota bacterium]